MLLPAKNKNKKIIFPPQDAEAHLQSPFSI
jgi:hypothetical protein